MSKFEVGDRVRLLENIYSSPQTEPGSIGEIIPRRGERGDYQVKLQGYSWKTGLGFYEYELELVTKGGDMKPTQRKTYKLMKELPELKKGALLQEKCDDGTQDFKVLDEAFVKYSDEHGRKDFKYPRQAVENEPGYFVEVFPVTPAFMTQAELDQWDAFKKAAAKPAARKPRVAKVAPAKATRGRKVKKAA